MHFVDGDLARLRRPLTFTACLLVTAAVAGALGCRGRNLAERALGDPASSELSAARCGGSGQIVRPLIVEWPATDRASLEGRLRRGLVVVRYEGCVVEVLRECSAPGEGYDYLGITRKNDALSIKTTDELYATMPLTAVELEAKLETAGELSVSMALVGNYEAPRARFDIGELSGRCEGATHVIAAAQVGAFEFYTGAAAEIGTTVEVAQVGGAGGRSTARREILNRDGDAEACTSSTPDDVDPPAECGALLRLELSALDGIVPTCQPGSVWNGSACVTEERAQTEAKAERDAAKAERRSENEEIARQLCEIQMECEAEQSGVAAPEGQGYERMINTCVAMTRPMINDFSRPQARKCIADAPVSGCAAFEACVIGPEDEEDPDFAEDSDWSDESDDW